jgi:Rps23 Pro-64 3,4-dihydroxylase Tpa1-like proline 4-hydroxylase
MSGPDFSGTEDYSAPFPHFRVPQLFSARTADAIVEWLDADAPWKLRIAEFYEQHEFSLMDGEAPAEILEVVSIEFVDAIAQALSQHLSAPTLELVDVCMHRLVRGQTIRIHNDHIGKAETHRLVVQLNRGWSPEQGGLFMLFARDDPESVSDILVPTHRSAFGFEISPRSHHAVSTVHAGYRDTLVYTFRQT